MGVLVDWAPTECFHAIPTEAKKAAAAMTAERRSDFPTRDLPKSAAIYVDIIAARNLLRQEIVGGRCVRAGELKVSIPILLRVGEIHTPVRLLL